ncbi:MAG: hypothetical protein ACO3JL_15135 [Myxococcota bacterium]
MMIDCLRMRGSALVVILAAALAAPVSEAADDAASLSTQAEKFSAAEELLWMGDQLKAVTRPLVLEYQFEKQGTLETGFRDQVRFIIRKVKPDGMKSAALEFFSGERQFQIPPEDSTNTNPVLKVYLQGDIYEMNRLTDPEGKARERWRYFQRRIKYAFADAAKMQPETFEFAGKRYDGTRVTITPYTDDPRRASFEKFADKIYSFVVSDSLPGFLYEIRTTIPGAEGAPPLIDETLRLAAISPLPQP